MILIFLMLKAALDQPQMIVLSDISESFMPLQSGFLVDPNESRYVFHCNVREVIETLLDTIPVIFGSNRLAEPALGAALTAGFEALVFAAFFNFLEIIWW